MLRSLLASRRSVAAILHVSVLLLLSVALSAQSKIVWSDQEKPIVEQIRGLRKLDDTVRTRTTKDLALQIRQLPAEANKLRLAEGLSNLSTEGDFGHDTLQEVATTLDISAKTAETYRTRIMEKLDLHITADLVRYAIRRGLVQP